MDAGRSLSKFDWVGVVFVAILGAGIGAMMVTAQDLPLSMQLACIAPGVPVGRAVWDALGKTAGVTAAAVSNGLIYGLVLYCWDRLANEVKWRLSHRRWAPRK